MDHATTVFVSGLQASDSARNQKAGPRFSGGCVAQKPLQILRVEVRAEWDSQSPLTETLVAKMSQIPERTIVASEPQPSPLTYSFTDLTPLDPEFGNVAIWLELADVGVALDQGFSLTISFDYISEAPPELGVDANCE